MTRFTPREQFTDRDYELFGVWPNSRTRYGRGKTLSRKAWAFIVLAVVAVACGALVAWVH